MTTVGLPHAMRTMLRRQSRRLARHLAESVLERALGQPRLRQLTVRALFERHLSPGTLCLVPFPDHALLVDPRDDKIGARLLGGRTWHRETLERALWLLERRGSLVAGRLFVDVGANIGALTVYAMRSGLFAGAVAIEPDPHNFAILARNMAINGLAGRVRLVQAAAGDRDCLMRLYRHARNFGAHHTGPLDGRADGGSTCRSRRLDDHLAALGIAVPEVGLVKIDVEGDELRVLAGMPNLRRAHVPALFEYIAAAHGVDGARGLAGLLAPDYGSLGVLASDDGGATATGVQTLADLHLGSGEYDLLAFAGGLPAGEVASLTAGRGSR